MYENVSKPVCIMAYPVLIDRVEKHVIARSEKLTDFYVRAIINQLENEGDWNVRDIVEILKAESEEK